MQRLIRVVAFAALAAAVPTVVLARTSKDERPRPPKCVRCTGDSSSEASVMPLSVPFAAGAEQRAEHQSGRHAARLIPTHDRARVLLIPTDIGAACMHVPWVTGGE